MPPRRRCPGGRLPWRRRLVLSSGVLTTETLIGFGAENFLCPLNNKACSLY
uniref:DUF3778 domain-containing protein n=1 Tax=Oryza glaberrima TaxID=4538 RepID=I1PVS4_ORYGL